MTNREWLNTLSDEEYTNELCNMRMFCVTELKNQMGVIRGGAESRDWLKWLQAQHETTADEDFAEMGFRPHNAGVTKAYWFQRESRDCVSIYETTIGYDGIFTDEEIDQFRTIADKKRKEMGWK